MPTYLANVCTKFTATDFTFCLPYLNTAHKTIKS